MKIYAAAKWILEKRTIDVWKFTQRPSFEMLVDSWLMKYDYAFATRNLLIMPSIPHRPQVPHEPTHHGWLFAWNQRWFIIARGWCLEGRSTSNMAGPRGGIIMAPHAFRENGLSIMCCHIMGYEPWFQPRLAPRIQTPFPIAILMGVSLAIGDP